MTTIQDLYPSRVEPTARFLERQDPVVHGSIDQASGPLSTEQLKQFDRDGFLFFPGYFGPADVAAFRGEIDRLSGIEEIRSGDGAILEPGSGEVRSIFAVHEISPIFRALAADRRIADMLRQILASEVYIHQSRINFKPGFKGKEFYWHSDFETWHVEDGLPRMRTVSCSILLTENNEFNGPLMVIPGSQRHYVACVGETPQDNYRSSLRAQSIGVPDPDSMRRLVEEGGITAPKGPAGSMLLFECNLMHGSSANISPWPRSNVFMVYNSMENQPEDPYCGLPPRPEHIASRARISQIEPAEPDYGRLAAELGR